MNKFGIQINRINKIQSPLPISIDKTFKSIFQSPFMSRTFLILHRDSVFLLIYLMQCLWIYSIIIPQFTRKYFSNFSNLQRNITSTERLFILDAVLSCARPSITRRLKQALRADYMEIFNPGWNFNSLNRVEISSWLNSKLLFKMTLQLHVKISTRYTDLKFELGLAKLR